MLENESHLRTVAFSYIDKTHKLVFMKDRLVTPCCRITLIRSELLSLECCPCCEMTFHKVFVKMIKGQKTTIGERFNLTYETGLPIKLGENESLSTRQKVALAFKNNQEPALSPGETAQLDLRIRIYARRIFRSLIYRAGLLDIILFNLPSKIGKFVYTRIF